MKKYYFPTILLFLFCLPGFSQGVVRLVPEAPEGKFEMGREYILLNSDSIDLELGFDGMHGENLVFDLVIINRTPYDLEVDPADFYYMVLDSATALSSRLPARTAMHPDRIINHYDETIGRGQEDKEINALLGFLEAGIGLLCDASAYAATEDPAYILDAIFSTIETASSRLVHDFAITSEIETVRSEKEIVTEEIFRKGTIPPGKVLSGYLFFPENADAPYYMFCFPVDNQLFQFVYRQQREPDYL